MDYGKIFTRAWDIIWKYKFLILLGVLVALSGGGFGGGGNQARYVFGAEDMQWGDMPNFDNFQPFQGIDLPLAAVGILVVVGVLILIGLVFWAAGTISRGGLINGVNEIEEENPTSLSEAFKAGWEKGWRLIGIGLVPSIPVLILMIMGIGVFLGYGGFEALSYGEMPGISPGFVIPLVMMACLLVPIAMILGLLRNFANRACMLEDLGVVDSYKRGFEVLGDNLGPALLLLLIQVALTIGVWVMMIIPGILMLLCCLLWPLLLLIEGAFTTYTSPLWTLAWREWTRNELVEVNQEIPSAN